MKILGIVLIVAGILGLVYQGFSYVKTDHVAQLGPIDITAKEHKFVWVSPVVSIVAIGAGVALLAAGARSRD